MFGAPRKHYDVNYAAWSDGHCPACAVADLIDAEIKHTESLTADEPGSYRHYALTPS